MYKFKLKENSEFEVGDVKVKDGTKSTVTDINPVTGAISWDLENVGAFDTVYKTFDELNQLLKTLESEGETESDPIIDSITDQVKKLFNQYRTHVRKNYPEAYDRIRMVKESVNEATITFKKHSEINIYPDMSSDGHFPTPYKKGDTEKVKKIKDKGRHYEVYFMDGDFAKIDKDLIIVKEEEVNENKFYVTRNLGRGQGKGLVKKFDDKTFQTLDEPRTFDSYEEAETFVKRRMSGGASPGQMTAYWISDENMNRIENVDEGEDKKLPNGDIYLGMDGRGNHKIKSNGKVTLYNNEDMVLIYGKGWGHKLNEEEIDEGEGIGYMTPNAFSKNKKSNNTYKYKLGSPFNTPVPKKIKGAGTIVKQLFEKEELTEYSDFQQKRINIFDDVEEKINSISPLLSNAKNETAQYYNENPGSYAIVYSTDMVNELLDDITKLLKQGE